MKRRNKEETGIEEGEGRGRKEGRRCREEKIEEQERKRRQEK